MLAFVAMVATVPRFEPYKAVHYPDMEKLRRESPFSLSLFYAHEPVSVNTTHRRGFPVPRPLLRPQSRPVRVRVSPCANVRSFPGEPRRNDLSNVDERSA